MDITTIMTTLRLLLRLPIPPLRLQDKLLSTLKKLPMLGEKDPLQIQVLFFLFLKQVKFQMHKLFILITLKLLLKLPIPLPRLLDKLQLMLKRQQMHGDMDGLQAPVPLFSTKIEPSLMDIL